MVVPYYFMIATWAPLFLFAFIFSSSTASEYCATIDSFIDHNLFSNVGMWTSSFPLLSKITINYLCLASPLFAVVFCYLTLSRSTFENGELDDTSKLKAFLCVIGFAAISYFFFYIIYLGSTDLMNARKFSIFGKHAFLYATYASGLMFLYYIFCMLGFFVCRFLIKSAVKSLNK